MRHEFVFGGEGGRFAPGARRDLDEDARADGVAVRPGGGTCISGDEGGKVFLVLRSTFSSVQSSKVTLPSSVVTVTAMAASSVTYCAGTVTVERP